MPSARRQVALGPQGRLVKTTVGDVENGSSL